MGFSQLGDLYNPTLTDIKITIDSMYSLMRQRQVDTDFRKKLENEIQKYKNELMIIEKKLELSQRECTQLKKQLGQVENQLQDVKQKMKENLTSKKNNKEDHRQAINKMEQKVTQISHEARKKENNYIKLQELYRSKIKDTTLYKNNFDIASKVSNESINELYMHSKECKEFAVHNLALMLKEGYERTQEKLMTENSQLKECLKLLQDEVTSILSELVEKMRGRLTESETKGLEAIQIKPIIFQTQIGSVLGDIYQIVRENICRIKDAIETLINLGI